MDDSELVPPSRLSMTDEELEAAVELAKSGPDGLIAAIVLLEEQTQLRAQDDASFAAFAVKNQSQNQQDAQPTPAPVEVVAAPVEVVAAPIEHEAEPSEPDEPLEPGVDYLDAPDEPEITPVAAPFEPTIASQVSSEFDAILGAAAEDEGEELFSGTDFSVTGALQQIVERVNDDFSQPQAELAPERDDEVVSASGTVEPSPMTAFASVQFDQEVVRDDLEATNEDKSHGETPKKVQKSTAFGSFFDSLIPSAIAATIAILISIGAEPETTIAATRVYGLMLGMVLATVFGLLVSKAIRLAGDHLNLISRSTFGVWGAAIPALGSLLFKLVAVAALVLALASPMWQAFNLFATQAPGTLRPALLLEFAVLALALVILVILSRFKWLSRWIFAVVAIGLAVLTVTSFDPSVLTVNESLFDALTTAAQTALTYLLVQLVFGFVRPVQARGANARAADYLAANLLLPALFATVLLFSVYVSQQWAVLSSVIILVAALASLAFMLRSSAESLELLMVKPVWARMLLAFALAGICTYFVGHYLVSLPLLLIVFSVPAAAAVFASLGDQLARRAQVHEVSLVRGYGFYGRASALNVGGFILSVLTGLALCPGFVWSAQTEAFAYLGDFSAPVASGLIAFLFTITISRIRVEHQEQEVLKVERRKNELAGIDEIVGLP